MAGLQTRIRKRVVDVLSLPGPGVITGAADDDPSGIATYSLAGARTGYSLLWMSLLTLPLNAALQNMCARIGLITGRGLADALEVRYRRSTLLLLVMLLLVANTANIGADIAAIAAGIELLIGVSHNVTLVPLGVAIALSEIVVPYRYFATYLKLLTLVLFTYVIDAFVASPDWGAALKRTLIPSIEFNGTFLTTIVALFGTTISPYLFFWQTSEEVEELHEHHKTRGTEPDIKREQLDVDIGMLLANVVFFFIILTTAATLYPAGIREINTAAEAAEALRPLAGDHATTLFAVGLIGTGLLSIPVLAGSAAYAVAEVFDWQEGLEENVRSAPQFYAVIALSTLVGLAIGISDVGAIRALFAAAVINGVVAPILIWAILQISNDSTLLGSHKNGLPANLLGYGAAVIMSLAALAMAISFVLGL
jgi:NRAMP (natural resistance-associated macrophage protein)-like metal ion transporter